MCRSRRGEDPIDRCVYVCVRACVCVASAKRATGGGGGLAMDQVNGLCRAVVLQRLKRRSCGFSLLLSCSLSEVRSGADLGVLSRLETGRRGNGRSGQAGVGNRTVNAGLRTLFLCAHVWRPDRKLRVLQLPCCCRCQIELMNVDDDQSTATRSVQLAATCLASWVVNGESG
jgi:hypothetical protein